MGIKMYMSDDYAKQAEIYLCRAVEAFEIAIDRVMTKEEINIFRCGAVYGMRFTSHYVENMLDIKN